MEEKVWEYIKEHGLFGEGLTVCAAVSGGADSMALLVCLLALSKQYSFELVCAHFEHGIRGESSLRDADFVRECCAGLKIPLFMESGDVPALAERRKISMETAAKHAREDFLNSLVRGGKAGLIATAHHSNDDAESVLMHILRGSGLNGLTGIRPKFGVFVRPFLCVSKKDILAYVKERDIPYVEDETNAVSNYRRNYIRNELFPAIEENVNADAVSALLRLSALAKEDEDFLEKYALKECEACARRKQDSISIDAERFNLLHPAIAGRVVRAACRGLGIEQDVEFPHIKSVIELARKNKTGSKVSLSRNLYARMEYGSLIIGFKGREPDVSFDINFDVEDVNRLPNGDYLECRYVEKYDAFNRDAFCECFDADKLPRRIKLRTRHDGDIIRPLRSSGKKKLKDYFIDKKLPLKERNGTPLLADGSNLIWVVGHVISDDYCVDINTKRIVQIKYCKKQG